MPAHLCETDNRYSLFDPTFNLKKKKKSPDHLYVTYRLSDVLMNFVDLLGLSFGGGGRGEGGLVEAQTTRVGDRTLSTRTQGLSWIRQSD